MAQSQIVINAKNAISISSNKLKPEAIVLKTYLDKGFSSPFVIQLEKEIKDKKTVIRLELSNHNNTIPNNGFLIKSDSKNIFLIAPNEKLLRYAIYTLLENWGFRKFTAQVDYIPNLKTVEFPKKTLQINKPSFEYRVLLYPDAYDEDFRDWHKLDWYQDDFSIWGHSFDMLVPPKTYFKSNPTFFALYEGHRNAESLCMSNDSVVPIILEKMKQIIADNPNATFCSVSQNDSMIYCECEKCKALNEKLGGSQGSLYVFLNKIAAHFPKTKITTLAYLHTYKAPENLKIAPNIYTFFCPIELNRGISLINDPNTSFIKTLQKWSATTSHLYLWDYTVQFSNYLSPFPNIQTFSDNYKLFKKNKVKGIFSQGYADVPGDFTELRQYVLAKLMWNTNIDCDATTNDFLRGFYGKAAVIIKKYLNLLAQNQQESNSYLDIYSGPVQSRATFLTPNAMNQYDQLLDEAFDKISPDSVLAARVQKLRLALEYAYFEQSKFYGKDQHGMFIYTENGHKVVKAGLTERVFDFTQQCTKNGIYELSEGGLSPEKYYEQWLAIANNPAEHLGENMETTFLTPPADDYKGKGSYGLVDGTRGYKNYNSNWIGWYGNNPEIELKTNQLQFNQLKINFLNDQRHWIFIPKKVTVCGLKNEKWVVLNESVCAPIEEKNTIETKTIVIENPLFKDFEILKITVENQDELPPWRKRKNKKPMVMLDEIEFYSPKSN
ncbi:DUF4838 domain-containing protein [Flavobacterium restrictum]|uniref:DUF4838 domain-containing protein n=1 Tax=Flavobacterium restrictum TaxID=2594428 RepID=A0A553E6X0_9FLAO|nr:DUF4838 domain-containing protein [Flavobacterium restrictum]TRX40794.1 DUF4838 domain-containing protein [Flavobacterium restrictum]